MVTRTSAIVLTIIQSHLRRRRERRTRTTASTMTPKLPLARSSQAPCKGLRFARNPLISRWDLGSTFTRNAIGEYPPSRPINVNCASIHS